MGQVAEPKRLAFKPNQTVRFRTDIRKCINK